LSRFGTEYGRRERHPKRLLIVSHEHLHHLMETARGLLQQYGYAGLFALIFVENFGFPVPGETVFIAAILAAAHGEMRILPVIACAWLASVLGGLVGFAIGRFGGHRVLQKYGGYIWINSERLSKIEAFSKKYGAAFVILARFFEGVRQIYAILAGCMAASWRSFILHNILGATLWVGFWTALVLWFGRHLRHIWDVFKEHEVYVFLGVALIAALSALLLHLEARRRARRTPNANIT
jgi:membrane protein DedA with SNARE-associated domain